MLALLSGAVVGVLLGAWTAHAGHAPGLKALAVMFPLGIAVVATALLVLVALGRRDGSLGIAAGAMAGSLILVAVVLGAALGPAPLTRITSGTGTAGTRSEPAALWSGPVTCEWLTEGEFVHEIDGFDVPITDAAFLDSQGARTARITTVQIDGEVRVEMGGGTAPGETWFEEDRDLNSEDARTGTAVFAEAGGIVLGWTCTDQLVREPSVEPEGTHIAATLRPSSPPGFFGDGTWRVGIDIAPGTYRATAGAGCYWERQSGRQGTFDEIIANGFGNGPRVVTIQPTDAAFESDGCGTWQLDAPPAPTAKPDDGTWRVGLDIAPGTYRTVGGEDCYWGRMLGLGGTGEELIADTWHARGPQVVAISATDAGFESDGCGTWQLNAPAVTTAMPGDGIWRVGLDVAPGTYEATVTDDCRWARLSGFGGTDEEDIASATAKPGPLTVTIDPGDAGFMSKECGSWTRRP